MNTETIILSLVIIVGFVVLATYLANKLDSVLKKDDSQGLLMLQQQISQISASLDKKVADQYNASSKIIKDVTEKLTKLDETNKQVVGITDQLQGLENILKNPKQRGILGEYYLETLLKNVFAPGMYKMQYEFKNGDIVDAAIFVKDKIIPIDSKFSLENYNKIIEEKNEARRKELEKVFKQDLKNRIDETAKYVRPEEGTMDFAFMFVPSEGIYYDLLVNQVGTVKANTHDLIEYAFIEKKVHIVSPTTLLSHLKMVLQGLKSLKIEESVKDIIKNVEMLGKHIVKYEEYMKKMGTSLGTTVSHYNIAYKEFKKVDKDVAKIAPNHIKKIEPHELEKPSEQ